MKKSVELMMAFLLIVLVSTGIVFGADEGRGKTTLTPALQEEVAQQPVPEQSALEGDFDKIIMGKEGKRWININLEREIYVRGYGFLMLPSGTRLVERVENGRTITEIQSQNNQPFTIKYGWGRTFTPQKFKIGQNEVVGALVLSGDTLGDITKTKEFSDFRRFLSRTRSQLIRNTRLRQSVRIPTAVAAVRG